MGTDERTQVHIYGQVYHLKGGNDPEHTQAVANLVDEQMNRVAAQTRVPDNYRVAVLTALHLADQYLNLKKDHDELRSQVAAKSNRLVSLLDKINNEEESASVFPAAD
jgi:cell division protein ZapA